MPEVALVLNPSSRRSAPARAAIETACGAHGMSLLVLPTTVADPGPGQAREALAAGVRRVVVAGGDGTVRHVAGVLGERGPSDGRVTEDHGSAAAPEQAVLGVVPVGTANLFARSVGLPRGDLAAAARLAVAARGRPMDLGRATLTGVHGGVTDQPFLVVVGLGHDADTVAAMSPALKKRLRWMAYLEPGLRRLSRPGRPVTLMIDGQAERSEEVWSVLAVNSARLPMRARVVPGARPDDGQLHIALVAPRNLRDWTEVARVGWGARHTGHPALRYEVGRKLVVRPAEPAAVQVDGDVVPDIVEGTITLEPGALSVAGPPT
ncbi:diacylglycerol/lipid kinase family protein [Ornithinimicrobium sp. Y1694]|uniref:diacylglycerol/lipid kinase family protein n=1 Tax=Ornithinimicrobium sp. Y1694 TaxID=3418590 RepID=UPI003CF24AC3